MLFINILIAGNFDLSMSITKISHFGTMNFQTINISVSQILKAFKIPHARRVSVHTRLVWGGQLFCRFFSVTFQDLFTDLFKVSKISARTEIPRITYGVCFHPNISDQEVNYKLRTTPAIILNFCNVAKLVNNIFN